jgi:hypothetical protein
MKYNLYALILILLIMTMLSGCNFQTLKPNTFVPERKNEVTQDNIPEDILENISMSIISVDTSSGKFVHAIDMHIKLGGALDFNIDEYIITVGKDGNIACKETSDYRSKKSFEKNQPYRIYLKKCFASEYGDHEVKIDAIKDGKIILTAEKDFVLIKP